MPDPQPEVLDLNCDLGEGEHTSTTKALLRYVTSANLACGGHASSPKQMEQTVQLAISARVNIGAHPGWPDRNSFGRAPIHPLPEEVSSIVLQQVSALHRITQKYGVNLHHVKLHGALYHACENDSKLARAFVETVQVWFPLLTIYARPNGEVLKTATKHGIKTWGEGFLDRSYDDIGNLVPRNQSHSGLLNTQEVRKRIQHWLSAKQLLSIRKVPIKMDIQTFCIHSDSPNAVQSAKIAREILRPQNQIR